MRILGAFMASQGLCIWLPEKGTWTLRMSSWSTTPMQQPRTRTSELRCNWRPCMVTWISLGFLHRARRLCPIPGQPRADSAVLDVVQRPCGPRSVARGGTQRRRGRTGKGGLCRTKRRCTAKWIAPGSLRPVPPRGAWRRSNSPGQVDRLCCTRRYRIIVRSCGSRPVPRGGAQR